jgi:exopolyphosphatase/guanosine-5'-triphosphate,3'-diphosphate pyrophosphatase
VYNPIVRRAVIDIGTNTLLLLVVEAGVDGVLTAVVDLCRFGRLGQGLDASGQLHPDAVARSLAICREYAEVMAREGVSSVDIIATQALREARNAADFLDPATAILGAAPTVISGEREAELAFLAAQRSLPALAGRPFVVADVGGGSTEVIVSDGARVVSAVSVPIGAVRLTERHLATDPPTAAERAAMVADIDAHFDRHASGLPRDVPLVASAGTASTLAALDQAQPYAAERVHGHAMSPPTLHALCDRLMLATTAARRAMPGMEAPRADVIAAGAAIFDRLAARLAAPTIVVSDRGIRWGLAYALVGRDT